MLVDETVELRGNVTPAEAELKAAADKGAKIKVRLLFVSVCCLWCFCVGEGGALRSCPIFPPRSHSPHLPHCTNT